MRPDEGQTEYEEVQKELSSKEEELQVIDTTFFFFSCPVRAPGAVVFF